VPGCRWSAGTLLHVALDGDIMPVVGCYIFRFSAANVWSFQMVRDSSSG
jgi:hypothetical protein